MPIICNATKPPRENLINKWTRNTVLMGKIADHL